MALVPVILAAETKGFAFAWRGDIAVLDDAPHDLDPGVVCLIFALGLNLTHISNAFIHDRKGGEEKLYITYAISF